MLTQRPGSAAGLDMTAGGSCSGSPTRTRWPPLRTRLTEASRITISRAWTSRANSRKQALPTRS
eukprot:8805065-Pyramimonas_sp.AAC.1